MLDVFESLNPEDLKLVIKLYDQYINYLKCCEVYDMKSFNRYVDNPYLDL